MLDSVGHVSLWLMAWVTEKDENYIRINDQMDKNDLSPTWFWLVQKKVLLMVVDFLCSFAKRVLNWLFVVSNTNMVSMVFLLLNFSTIMFLLNFADVADAA